MDDDSIALEDEIFEHGTPSSSRSKYAASSPAAFDPMALLTARKKKREALEKVQAEERIKDQLHKVTRVFTEEDERREQEAAMESKRRLLEAKIKAQENATPSGLVRAPEVYRDKPWEEKKVEVDGMLYQLGKDPQKMSVSQAETLLRAVFLGKPKQSTAAFDLILTTLCGVEKLFVTRRSNPDRVLETKSQVTRPNALQQWSLTGDMVSNVLCEYAMIFGSTGRGSGQLQQSSSVTASTTMHTIIDANLEGAERGLRLIELFCAEGSFVNMDEFVLVAFAALEFATYFGSEKLEPSISSVIRAATKRTFKPDVVRLCKVPESFVRVAIKPNDLGTTDEVRSQRLHRTVRLVRILPERFRVDFLRRTLPNCFENLNLECNLLDVCKSFHEDVMSTQIRGRPISADYLRWLGMLIAIDFLFILSPLSLTESSRLRKELERVDGHIDKRRDEEAFRQLHRYLIEFMGRREADSSSGPVQSKLAFSKKE